MHATLSPPRTFAPRRQFLRGASHVGLLGLWALAGCSPAGNNAMATPASAPVSAASGVADDALALAREAKGFTAGAMMAANTAYVFFDTSCPHCAHLWQAAQPLLPKLKMVWIPVGLLRPQSTTQGVAILGAANPVATMNENETSVLAHGPGIATPGTPDPALVAQVKANTELLRRLGADSVPLLLFRHAKTGQVGRHEGAMDTAALAELIGI